MLQRRHLVASLFAFSVSAVALPGCVDVEVPIKDAPARRIYAHDAKDGGR
jgi:hypothetical protein